MKNQITTKEFLTLAQAATITSDHHNDDCDYNVFVDRVYNEHGGEDIFKDLLAGAVWNNIDINGVTFEQCQAWSMYDNDSESFDIGDHPDGCNRMYSMSHSRHIRRLFTRILFPPKHGG